MFYENSKRIQLWKEKQMPIPTLTKGYSERGSDMGRRTFKTDNDDQRFFLQKVRLDNGGYDPGGAYWGCRQLGLSLYRYVSEDHDGEGFIDARNRTDAKAKVIAIYPKARFFN